MPVKFASRSFTPVEGRWPTIHQELFAIKYSLEHFRPYLLGRAVTIITDHANFQWFTSISPQQFKLARCCLSMAKFDFQIKHRAGSANVVPDVPSRAPLTHPSASGEDLYFPPQAVTCFITTLIGFDIPYLEPSQVSEIFSDSLTCLTLACNPTPLLSLATCLKPYPSGFPTGHSSLLNPTPQKDPLAHHLFPEVAPPVLAKPEDPQSHYPLNSSRALLATKQWEGKWLGPLYRYLLSGGNVTELAHLTKSNQSWVKSTASRCKIVDDLMPAPNVNPELSQVAYEFGKYLSSLPNKTATASQACKQVYLNYLSARQILSRHGKLRGLVNSFSTRCAFMCTQPTTSV